MKLIIDGDACPVKKEIIEVAATFELSVVLVASTDHHSLIELPSHVSVTYVERGADSADFKIVQLVNAGDCVITQDYGLAALVLGKKAYAMHHLGKQYRGETIGMLLESRHYNAQVRKSGGRTKGPKKITETDRLAFKDALQSLLTQIKDNA